jgi:hypothetical protein
MRALAQTVDGVFEVDLEEEIVVGVVSDANLESLGPEVALPRVIATGAAGSTVVAVVDRRPPLAVSHDAGLTWREAGGGLPAGRAVAVAEENPDLVLYAARNRLYLSTDGARFWRALTPELPEIQAVAFA